MNLGQNKVFERPQGGSYLGTIIDLVEMPQQPTRFGPKDKVRILWVLSHINGAPYLDKEGQPMTIAGFYNATVSDNSNLTKAIRQILSAQPPQLGSTEDLARLLIGRSNQLFLTQEPDAKNPGQFVTFVAGIAPLPPGVIAPQAPAGFQRVKDRPQQTSGPKPGQTSQTFAQRPAPVNAQGFYQPPAAPASQAPVNLDASKNDAF